jgi:hypothetical protein
MVTWRGAIGRREWPCSPVANQGSCENRSWGPYERCAALGAASSEFQRQPFWHAAIMHHPPDAAIRRNTEICTELSLHHWAPEASALRGYIPAPKRSSVNTSPSIRT